MRKKGFSLLEVIVAVTVIGVIGIFVSTILSRSYNAGNQSVVLGNLKQNGQTAISIMAETIRNSEGVICYGGSSQRKNEIVIRNLQGKYIKYRFVDPVISNSTITANGYITKQEDLDPNSYSSFCTSNLSSPQPVAITNNNSTSGVSISEGEFEKLTPATASKDAVMISFYVSSPLTATSSAQSETAFMQTTVQVR